MGDFFVYLYNKTKKYKGVSIVLLIIYLTLGLFAASKIKFTEDITNALPKSEIVNQSNFVFNHSKFLDKVILNIHFKDSTKTNPDSLSYFAQIYTDSLKQIITKDNIADIKANFSQDVFLNILDTIYNNLPVFFSDSDFAYLNEITTKENIYKTVNSNFKSIISPVGFFAKQLTFKDPFGLSLRCSKKLQNFQINNNFKIYNNFIISKDNKNILVFIIPKDKKSNKKLVSYLIGLSNYFESSKYKQFTVDFFGAPVVAQANAQQIKKDIYLTLSFTLLLLIFIISYVFRQKFAFIFLLLPVLFGALTAIIFIYLFQGYVSAISLGIGSVLLGITIDYSLHIFSHIRQSQSIEESLKAVSTPLIISSLTTVSAFLVLLFINSPALHDLALFSAVSVFSSALFSLVILPHLSFIKKASKKNTIIDKIASYNFHKNKYLILAILAVSVFLYFFARNTKFEANLDKFNFMPPELKTAQQNINKLTGSTERIVYLISFAENFDDALNLNDSIYQKLKKLRNTNKIKHFVSLNMFFNSKKKQKENIKKFNDFWKTKNDSIKQYFIDAGKKYHFKPETYNEFFKAINKKSNTLSFDKTEAFKKLFLQDYLIESKSGTGVINIVYLNKNQNTKALKHIANKNKNIWLIDRRNTITELVNILKSNFSDLLNISMIVVFLILLLSYGRIELALAGLIPIFLSWVWVLGIMGIAGLSFNIINIIIVSFIFGLGVDYSVFITNGILYKFKYGKSKLETYKFSVLLSVLTTLLGIGALIFAKHPALRSIALLSIIGITATVLISFTILPVIINWLLYNNGEKRERVITLVDFVFSVLSLLVFVAGAVLLNVEIIILKLLPFNKDKKKIFFHHTLKYFAWFLIYMNFFSKKRIINTYKENFNKPAVIIANHQSHIDLMLIMLLTHKVVILTNSRNYNNPIYGHIVRYAGFINSDLNYENITKKIQEQISKGYSIMIFPEGTRSDSGKIKRFHKGATYIAEQLNLEILPLVFHGANKLLRKHEFVLKRGAITTKILKRINLDKQYPNKTTRERTKELTKLYRFEYENITQEYAQTDFNRSYIIKNFVYKGPVLEWYTKIKISLENNYKLFNEIVPHKAVITDIGCGYGYLDFMLALCQTNRKVTGIDYDSEKINVANNCSIKNDNLTFISGDALEVDIHNSDVFILNDVLHYMPKNKQTELLNRCYNKLNNNGIIIIRDGDTDKKQRQKGTWLTELFSTKIIKFNKTKYDKLDFLSKHFIEEYAKSKNLSIKIIDKSKLTSNTIFILGK